jgi:hypothetical protein
MANDKNKYHPRHGKKHCRHHHNQHHHHHHHHHHHRRHLQDHSCQSSSATMKVIVANPKPIDSDQLAIVDHDITSCQLDIDSQNKSDNGKHGEIQEDVHQQATIRDSMIPIVPREDKTSESVRMPMIGKHSYLVCRHNLLIRLETRQKQYSIASCGKYDSITTNRANERNTRWQLFIHNKYQWYAKNDLDCL